MNSNQQPDPQINQSGEQSSKIKSLSSNSIEKIMFYVLDIFFNAIC